MANKGKIPEGGFTDHDQTLTWLKTRSPQECVVLAVRSALRVVPLLSMSDRTKINKNTSADLILSCFRVVEVSLSAGTWPDSVSAYEEAAFAAFAADAKLAVVSSDADAFAALSGLSAANAVKAANVVAYAANAAAHAGSAINAAANAAYVVAADALALESGEFSAENLHKAPLWGGPDGMPEDMQAQWNSMRNRLLALDQNWQVWTNWYDARLRGDPLHKEKELVRVTELSEDDWKQGPAHVNAMLQAIEDRFAPKIPPANPATIRTVWRDGKVFLDHSVVDSDLEEKLALAKLLALRDEFIELANSADKEDLNFDKRPATYLRKTSELIGPRLPDSPLLFRLILREEILITFEQSVREQWPGFLSLQYSMLCSKFSDALDQFPDRRKNSRHVLEVEIETLEPEEIQQDIETRVDVLATDLGQSRIDGEIPKVIQQIGAMDSPETADNNMPVDPVQEQALVRVTQADQLESLNSVTKALAHRRDGDPAIKSLLEQIDQGYVDGFAGSLVEGAQEAGKSDGKKLGAGIARAKAGVKLGIPLAQRLSNKYPKMFGWLGRFT